MKVAVIGAGSSYTPELIDGLISSHEQLPVDKISFMDIDEERLSVVASFSKRMLAEAGTPFQIEAATELGEALKGADFVVTQIRVGGQEGRHFDISLGKEHGVVGQETTGVGGFSKALRTIPVILDICEEIEKYAPGARLINFTNPSGIITEAVNWYTDVDVIGLCNVPINMKMRAAEVLKVDPEDIFLDYVGLNHLAWVRGIYYRGVDRLEEVLQAEGEAPANVSNRDFPRRLLSALKMIPSPYLRYYYNTESVVEWQAEAEKTRAEEVMEIEEKLFNYYRQEENVSKPELLTERGGAYYSHIATDLMTAVYNDSQKEFIVNVPNQGAVADFRDEDVMEIPAIIGKTRPRPVTIGRVEPEIAGLMYQVKVYERLTVKAAVERNYDKALLALNSNPLVDEAAEAVSMLDKIIEHYDLNLEAE